MSRVLCLMSGGVDSSVTALLLKEMGHEVIGLTLSLWWDDEENTCCGVAANCKARDVCEKLGIEHYTLNKRTDFMAKVVDPFVQSHQIGETPSPCLNCNTYIKIGGMEKYADFFKADLIATGHYVVNNGDHLHTAADLTKDQTYMLSRIDRKLFPRLLFPLGALLKTQVREIAERNGFPAPSDSQDLCFVSSENRTEFLNNRGVDASPGNFINTSGEAVGEHSGIYNYTVGQRKGIQLPSSEKLYVLRVNHKANTVTVGKEEDLLTSHCFIRDFNWHIDHPINKPLTAKLRYRSHGSTAKYSMVDGMMRLDFDEPQRAITPGQAAVLYDGGKLLGGGWIADK